MESERPLSEADGARPDRARADGGAPARVDDAAPAQPAGFVPYAAALGVAALCTGVSAVLRPLAGVENVDLVYLTGVILVAVRYGLAPSLFGSAVSVMAYNWFFIPPLHTFAIETPTHTVALAFFAAVAAATSHLAARARSQALRAEHHARVSDALYGFSRHVAEAHTLEDLATTVAERIGSTLHCASVLLLPAADGELRVAATWPAQHIEPDELARVTSAWTDKDRAEPLRVGARLFSRLGSGERLTGILGLSPLADRIANDDQQVALDDLAKGLMQQAAVAIERAQIRTERDQARLAAETEQLRSAILASVSHDLKTPLAAITGAVTALTEYPDLYDAESRTELLSTIRADSERLSELVTNLLDMARLQAGPIALNIEAVDVGEVIGTALRRTATVLQDHDVSTALDGELPMLRLDPVLFEQALVNVLENAGRHTPPGTPVLVQAGACDGRVEVRVCDAGPGFAPSELQRVFDRFYTRPVAPESPAGTGLGLAISKGFIEALGGAIRADNRHPAGAVVTMSFPQAIWAAVPRDAADP